MNSSPSDSTTMSSKDKRGGTRGISTLNSGSRAQSGVRRLVPAILVIVVAAVVAFIGVDVISEVDDSIEVTTGSDFDNSTNSVSSGFTSAMDLIEVVFIVIMASVILAVLGGVMRFGR